MSEQDEGEPPKVKTKKLYSLLKHSKQDLTGIVPLKKDGQTLLTETRNFKANALNDQFQSVFSPKNIHKFKVSCPEVIARFVKLPFQPSPHPKMPDISIAAKGIGQLLVGLKRLAITLMYCNRLHAWWST